MKKLIALSVFAFSLSAVASTWNNVTLIDKSCARKAAADPDAHTTKCATGCAGAGYGILTSDGKFLKFDKSGDDESLKLLQATDKKDHLRVTVEGDEKDGTIAVKSIKFD
jgi:hypothetical protein